MIIAPHTNDNKNNYKNKYFASLVTCVLGSESRLARLGKQPEKLIILYCKDICFYALWCWFKLRQIGINVVLIKKHKDVNGNCEGGNNHNILFHTFRLVFGACWFHINLRNGGTFFL